MVSITEKVRKHEFKKFQHRFLRFGSLATLCNFIDEVHFKSILQRFRLWPEPGHLTSKTQPLNVFLIPYSPPFEGFQLSPDSISIQTNQKLKTIEIITRSVVGVLDKGQDPWHFLVAINPDEDDLGKYLFRVFNRFLTLLDYVHVHAAAILEDEIGVLFVGDKGSGKSSICLHLGLAGQTILGEDHIMLRRSGGLYYASGCDDKMRVSEKTEEFFFDYPLSEEPADFAGVLKKEINLSDYVNVLPYVDKPVGHIFFPKIGDRFSVSKISSQQAFQRLMEKIWPLHRFADAEDQGRLMNFLGNLVMTSSSYELHLSQDLTELRFLDQYLNKLS